MITANQAGSDIYDIAPPVMQSLNVTGDPITGITQTLEFQGDIKIYPNPVIDQVRIDIGNLNILGGYGVNIYTITGQSIYSVSNQNNPQISIDLSNIPNGVYIVNIITQEGVKSHKLIKE